MNRSEIIHLGWDDEWEATLAASAATGLPGRISRVERGECDVLTEDGEQRALSDSQRSQSRLAPVTGDWVTLERSSDSDVGDDVLPLIEMVLERRTLLVRKDPGEREEHQPLAANVDVVLLVHGFDRPLRPGKLERFLVLAWNAGATPIVVLTKADLVGASHVADLVGVVEAVAPGVQVIVSSSLEGDEAFSGVEQVRVLLSGGQTATLLGESGAGKSTMVNALLGREVQETKEVRHGDAKGRHTTITRDLIVLPTGGFLIDTPGIRAVGLWDARDALEQVFSDITELASSCRFGDCAHNTEPGCAVRDAVEDGEVDPRRLDRYVAMGEELQQSEQRLVERDRATSPGRRRRRSG